MRKGTINGLNVTVPFKKIVIPFLDDLTAVANEAQSVNTIYTNNDKVIGHNTDTVSYTHLTLPTILLV